MQKKTFRTNQSFMLEVKMAAKKKAIWSSPDSASKPLTCWTCAHSYLAKAAAAAFFFPAGAQVAMYLSLQVRPSLFQASTTCKTFSSLSRLQSLGPQSVWVQSLTQAFVLLLNFLLPLLKLLSFWAITGCISRQWAGNCSQPGDPLAFQVFMLLLQAFHFTYTGSQLCIGLLLLLVCQACLQQLQLVNCTWESLHSLIQALVCFFVSLLRLFFSCTGGCLSLVAFLSKNHLAIFWLSHEGLLCLLEILPVRDFHCLLGRSCTFIQCLSFSASKCSK